ncbi:unnamed protein product [Caenorhabditis brenneri]
MSDSFRQCKMCDELKLDKDFSFVELVCRECYWSKRMSLGRQELRNDRKCEHQDPTKSAPTSDSERQDSGTNSPCPTLRSISPDTPVLPVLTGRLSPHHSAVFCSNEMCRVKILAGKTRHPKTGMKWICQICRAYFLTYQKDRVTKEFQAMLDLVVKALASPIFKLPPLPQNSRWTWSEWKNILQKTFPGDFLTNLIVEHRLRNGFNDVPVFEDPDDGAGPAPRMLSPIIVNSEVRAAPPPSNSHCTPTVIESSVIPEKPDVLESVPAPQPPSKHVFLNDSPAPKASAAPKKPIAYKNAPARPSAPAPKDDEPPPQASLLKPAPNLSPNKPTALVEPSQVPSQAPLPSAVKSNFPEEYQPATRRSLSFTSIEPENCQESPLDLSSTTLKESQRAPASPDDSYGKPSRPQAREAHLPPTTIFAEPAPPRAASQAITNPNVVSVIRFAPKCFQPFIGPAPNLSETFVEPAPKFSTTFVKPATKYSEPFIESFPKLSKPFIGPAPKCFKPPIGPAPKSSKHFIEPALKPSKRINESAPKSSKSFNEPAPKPSKPFIEQAPKCFKPPIGPAPKSAKTFIEPAPKPSIPFTGPAQKPSKSFIGTAPDPSRLCAQPIPSTSVPGTSTTTTATINRIENLVTSIAPPPPPPETLIVPKIYSQIFHVCGNDGICMRPMARRVFVDMETGKKVCYSCIRRKPRSSRQLPVAVKKPRMEDDAKN